MKFGKALARHSLLDTRLSFNYGHNNIVKIKWGLEVV